MRWLNPLLCFGAAAFVWQANSSTPDRQLVLPGMSWLAGPDLHAQGAASWKVLAGLGVLMTAWALLRRPKAP